MISMPELEKLNAPETFQPVREKPSLPSVNIPMVLIFIGIILFFVKENKIITENELYISWIVLAGVLAFLYLKNVQLNKGSPFIPFHESELPLLKKRLKNYHDGLSIQFTEEHSGEIPYDQLRSGIKIIPYRVYDYLIRDFGLKRQLWISLYSPQNNRHFLRTEVLGEERIESNDSDFTGQSKIYGKHRVHDVYEIKKVKVTPRESKDVSDEELE
jgi:hypothetical protein